MKNLSTKIKSRLAYLLSQIDLFSDFHSFKRRYAFFAQGTPPVDRGRKVLVVSLTDWVAQVKMEGVLAKALQLRGYMPVILTYRSCRRALRYFRVFGFDQFVFLDEWIQRVFLSSIETEAKALLNGKYSFSSILNFQYRGVDSGRHILSSIVRSLRHGSVEFSNPEVINLLKQYLLQSLQSARAAELLLEQVKPQMALFLEKGYSPYGEIFDAALSRGVNTIQFLHSHRSDALVLKRYTKENRHQHPFSLSPESWNQAKQMPWTDRHETELMQELKGRYEEGTWFNRKYLQVGKKIKSVQEVRRQLGLDSNKKTAVIFSHVLWDATFFYGENLFDDYEQWLVETVKAACSNRNVNWVIKLHPDYVWKMKQMGDRSKPRDLVVLSLGIGRLPDHIKILEPDTDISTFSLFDVTDYCVTVRGTIGIEMSCFGTPVFTAGTGRYAGLGFTIDSTSREEYLAKICRIHEFPRLSTEQVSLAKKHAYILFKLRPCPFQTFEVIQQSLDRLGHPLDQNMVIHANRLQDIAEARDLVSFSDWAVDSSQADFLIHIPIHSYK